MITQYHGRIETLKGAIETVWGDTDEGIRYLAACARASADLNDIEDQRGVLEAVVPVVGTKNAGKTTFCQLLLNDSHIAGQLRAGYLRADATTSLTWLGATKPARMDPQVETWVPLSRQQLFDAGRPYMLVDVPGFNDSQPAAREAALRIMAMASVIVLVVSWETMDIESLKTYLRYSGGATIVPVLVDDAFQGRPQDQAEREMASLRKRLEADVPLANVLDPIRVPRISAAPAEEQNNLRNVATAHAREAIQRALTVAGRDSAALARARYDKLLLELEPGVQPFLNRVKPHHESLLKREKAVVQEITPQLIGSREQLHAGVRARIMIRVAQSSPAYSFPFRQFLHLLAITAGAWDRLVLSLSGSFPSLALLLFHTRSNLRLLRKRQEESRTALLARIEETFNREIAEPHGIFVRSVRQSVHRNPVSEESGSAARYRLHGFPAIEALAQSIVERNVGRVPVKRGVLGVFALVAVLAWLALAMGPLFSIYGQYLSASAAAITTGRYATWEAFPIPSFGMFFVTAGLVFLPVFVLAMITLVTFVRGKTVEDCSSRIEQQIREEISGLIDTSLVTAFREEDLKRAVLVLRKEFDRAEYSDRIE